MRARRGTRSVVECNVMGWKNIIDDEISSGLRISPRVDPAGVTTTHYGPNSDLQTHVNLDVPKIQNALPSPDAMRETHPARKAPALCFPSVVVGGRLRFAGTVADLLGGAR